MTDRDVVIASAESRFDVVLVQEGEGICIASLPMRADEIAAEAAAGDPLLEAEIVTRLRRRAGLHA